MRRAQSAVILVSLFSLASPAMGAEPGPLNFQPDPVSVERYGPAYRYPQAGWIVLHTEGAPYERGYQHGRLLAPEIAAFLRCFAAIQSPQAPVDGWKITRSLVNALFVRRYEKEYLEEMKGIADGATAAGARFDGRPVDLVDIVALNSWPEFETLNSALGATPTGLEGLRFPHQPLKPMPASKPMHCSAFAATGPATRDGKVVFGHITMFGLYPSLFYNVWLDVKPTAGHRVLMQTYPGGIQSGLDYYLNDAGILVCETTIKQTRFDIQGKALGSRIRQALQYADSIDRAAEVLTIANNGLYTNEWLLADVKTNEIAMFELGTAKTKLYRSSKKEWFGGTEGFYWGCNNTKDLDVRLETIPSVHDAPANMVWRPSDRDKTWLRLYHEYKGKMDADFGRIAFTTPPVAAYHSLDAKYTTTDMAKKLQTWALFGPPLGRTWEPTREERQKYPEVRPLVTNPWTILHTNPPTKQKPNGLIVVDLPERPDNRRETRDRSTERDRDRERERDRSLALAPAWHGTLLPRTDADIWLAAAFADYEKIVSLEKGLRDRAADGRLSSDDRGRLALNLFSYRTSYTAAARAAADVPLAKTHPELIQNNWYRVAAGKGVLVLHELRQLLGDDMFKDAMDSFGRDHAGKEVTVADFQAHVAKTARMSLDTFFDYWTRKAGLPSLHLDKVRVVTGGHLGGLGGKGEYRYAVTGEIRRESSPLKMTVAVTVETAKGEVTKSVALGSDQTTFDIDTAGDKPRRLIVDKYGWTAKANGGPFNVLSFVAELNQTLIVYGTGDEVPTNREAAEELQRAIIQSGPNITVPIKADGDVTDEDMKTHHLLLIGRPDSNRCVNRVRSELPVTFSHRSFTVVGGTYGHPGSAVVAAAANPANRRYSVVVLAGLSAESTRQTAAKLLQRGQPAGDVCLLPAGGKPRMSVLPAPGLVWEESHAEGKAR
jgi:hypothetical protein